MRSICCLLALLVTATGFSTEDVPQPANIESEEFRSVIVRVGDDLYIAGQPTEAGFAWLKEKGVTTVINLRTQREMDSREQVPFDQSAVLEELGLDYVHIPSGGPDTPYAVEMVELFASALKSAEGKVLLHCTVAWRASHLWAAYLYRHKGVPLGEAVRHAQEINLGSLPLEGFLGEKLTIELAESESVGEQTGEN